MLNIAIIGKTSETNTAPVAKMPANSLPGVAGGMLQVKSDHSGSVNIANSKPTVESQNGHAGSRNILRNCRLGRLKKAASARVNCISQKRPNHSNWLSMLMP